MKKFSYPKILNKMIKIERYQSFPQTKITPQIPTKNSPSLSCLEKINNNKLLTQATVNLQ